MRYVSIDLSSDNYLQQPKIFGGYAGEHNETILQVKLPDRMVGIEYSGYRFDFQTSEDNEIPSPLIPVSELNNGILSFHLTEQLTIAGKLLFNVVAQLFDGDVVALTSKTNMVALYIGDSPDGNSVLPDPNGYKDEILKMIDARILEINPASVDQTYNPNSPNAQSGKAVKAAINDTLYEFEEIPIEYVSVFLPYDGYKFYDSSYNGVYEVIDIDVSSEWTWLDIGIGTLNFYGPPYTLPYVGVGSKIYIEIGKQEAFDAYWLNKVAVGKDKYLTANARKVYFSNNTSVSIFNNTELIASEPINYLDIYYPATDFICSISFTIADGDSFTINFPDGTKYVGGVPEFKNGETWELNIKNGVVVAGKVEEVY